MTDKRAFVVIDVNVLILLRVDVDFFLVAFVFKAQLVIALALVGLALDGHACLMARQFIGRQLQRHVRSAGDDRLVRIAVQIVHDDFLSDPRYCHVAPSGARPVL
ncbi:hypothetical protein D3C77_699410 [compost metagenome]